MIYSFLDLAKETLHKINKPLSINDIWEQARMYGLTDKVGSSGKTPWQTLGARIYMDIKQNPNTEFVQTSKRPALFYLKELGSNNLESDNSSYIDETSTKVSYNERDLHPLLTTFVYSNPHFRCYTKTIYHENSKKNKKGYNKWLHPDLVGIYFPFDEFQGNTLKLLETLKENPYKLFSFEMKIELNLYNLREYFFQAVSNSSWAHEGYLVCLNIDNDPSLLDEIRRLNNAFGIGIIKLDAVNIEQSEILFTARNKEILDWETIDRLTEENKDFQCFIDDLIEDVKLGKVKSKYDCVFNEIGYREYLTSKNIS